MEDYLPKWVLQQYSDLSPVQFYFTLLAVFIAIAYLYLRNRNLPPGPTGVPILGYYPFLKDSECHLQLLELQKKYGDVFCFNYAGALMVNLGSPKALREFHVANGECFERVNDFTFLGAMFKKGVIFSNGELWKITRKFSVRQFKEIGMSTLKEAISEPVLDSVQETVDYLMSKKGQPVDVVYLLTQKCILIVRRILFGDDGITVEELRQFIELYSQITSFLSIKNFLLVGNISQHLIFPLQPGYRKAWNNYDKIMKLIHNVLERHRQTYDESNPRDFIDSWWNEAKLRQSKNDPTAKYFTDQALMDNIHQFAGDGVLAIAAFVATFIIYAVQHPKEQEIVYEELTDVIGPDRNPVFEDKNKLPYTNAFMLEIQRLSNFFILFSSQQCIKETTIRGYRIPKGTVTLMNMWACHHNPEVYEDPDTFDPSRWLPKEGKPRPELPVSFGIGKRSCMGEAYVITQTFLFFTTLIKNFKFTIADSSTTSFYDILTNLKMDVIATPRN